MIKNFQYFAALVLVAILALPEANAKRVIDSEYYPCHEMYIQYGTPSVLELATTLTKGFKSVNAGVTGNFGNYKFSGIPAIGYNYSFSEKVSGGIYAGFGYTSADLFLLSDKSGPFKNPVKVCRVKVMSYTAQLMGQFVYWTYGALECSGAIYLGVSYMDEELSDVNSSLSETPKINDRAEVSYHLTAIKVRYGETIGVFAELGFGFRGLVNVGLSIKI